jgi:flagellar capping protein FliD
MAGPAASPDSSAISRAASSSRRCASSRRAVKEKKVRMESKWEAVSARYTAQFNALDTLLAGLKSTSTYLETQLENLPGTVFNNKRR